MNRLTAEERERALQTLGRLQQQLKVSVELVQAGSVFHPIHGCGCVNCQSRTFRVGDSIITDTKKHEYRS